MSCRPLVQPAEEPQQEMTADVVAEALRYVHKNKGYRIKEGVGSYPSPRISSEIMDCSMPVTFDHLSACSLGCTYCFAAMFKQNNPSYNPELHPVNVDDLIKTMQGNSTSKRGRVMYELFYKKKFLLHWGGLADPFCNFEHANRIGYPLLQALGDMNYPTLLSFKGRTIMEDDYLQLFQRYSRQRNFAFQISMVTGDDRLGKQVEVGVPLPSQRLEAIKILSDMGYWTILRLRPFIIGITDHSLDDLLHRALESGIKGVSTEFFAMDGRVNISMKTRYDWLAKLIGVDNLIGYFKDLSPHERGGYMRLNRLVKEPHIRKIYEFCLKHDLVLGISDPDFKELNFSGSCCAMPDNYAPNRSLENWTRNQLTYHLKELRKAYHRGDNSGRLHFLDVFSSGAQYLDENRLIDDHVSIIGMCEAERRQQSYRSVIRRHWNNLRSPANPRNYFHGKLMPISVDENGDLVYKYNPSEYEQRWLEEGVDLSR